MSKKYSSIKPVHSFLLSHEGLQQIKDISGSMRRNEGDVFEGAIDRMNREEFRLNNLTITEKHYPVDNYDAEKKEI